MMPFGMGESTPIPFSIPAWMAAEVEDARKRGALDIWNGPIEQNSRDSFQRVVQILIDGKVRAELVIEFTATPESWWARIWRMVTRRKRPMPDPRLSV